MSYSNSSSSPIQSRPRAFSRSSTIDLAYSCVDLTDELVEESPHTQGGGSFSDVYKYKERNIDPPIYYAVKSFRYHTCYKLSEKQTERRIKREIQSWVNLRHANVLRLEGILYRPVSPTTKCPTANFPCLVSPWMNNGTAKRYVESTPDINLLKFISGLANGLSYMHRKGTAHGDIRGDNILVSDNGEALICDFGLSKIIESLAPGQTASSIVGYGATRYRAPEFFLPDGPEKPTMSGDVWMFGMTVLELWSGQIPFPAKIDTEVMTMLYNKERPDFSETIPKRADFIASKERVLSICALCWIIGVANRPSMSTIAALVRVLANEAALDDTMGSADALGPSNDNVFLTESLASLSVTESPVLVQKKPSFVLNDDNNSSPTSKEPDETLSSSPTTSLGSSGAFSSLTALQLPESIQNSSWSDIPKPPPSSVDAMLQANTIVFRSILHTYRAKKGIEVNYITTRHGPDASNVITWKATCKVGLPVEELGFGESHGRKAAAEEQAAREAVQKLKMKDLSVLSQCLPYLSTLRSHLARYNLMERVHFNDLPPTGPAHNLTFTCEAKKDGVKVCEGYGLSKADAQEQAARNFATVWREGSL